MGFFFEDGGSSSKMGGRFFEEGRFFEDGAYSSNITNVFRRKGGGSLKIEEAFFEDEIIIRRGVKVSSKIEGDSSKIEAFFFEDVEVGVRSLSLRSSRSRPSRVAVVRVQVAPVASKLRSCRSRSRARPRSSGRLVSRVADKSCMPMHRSAGSPFS